MAHRTMDELNAILETMDDFPMERGVLNMIARRPAPGERDIVEQVTFDVERGVVGDNWLDRGSKHTDDGSAHPDMQVTIMNNHIANLVAGSRERWVLAGDQLYTDLDLSIDNLPPGQRIAIGSAVLEITEKPHTGCKKFAGHYGTDALKLIMSKYGGSMRGWSRQGQRRREMRSSSYESHSGREGRLVSGRQGGRGGDVRVR